jgi:hypothetical protein
MIHQRSIGALELKFICAARLVRGGSVRHENPDADARSLAAPPNGMWSAMRSSEPPSITHFLTASISCLVNA